MNVTVKRIIAFLIDCLILTLITSLIVFIIPRDDKVESLNNNSIELFQKYMDKEISNSRFVEATNDLNYELLRIDYIQSIISIAVYILYFAVFQSFNHGQTFGKKILKIRIVKDDGSGTIGTGDINTLLIRSIIPYGILINIINVTLILLISKEQFITITGVLSTIHMIILIVTISLMFIKSKGLHDYITKTRVENI